MVEKTGNFLVNVSPEMQLYKVLQRQSYDIGTALSEFVDNSVQAFSDKKTALESAFGKDVALNVTISILSKKKQIIIEDTASGINRADFQRAIRMGHEGKFKHSDNSLSVYGIGMKSAATWFSDTWSIETSALGSKEQLSTEFDLNDLLQTGNEEIEVVSNPEKHDTHYTRIVINNCMRDLEDKEEFFKDNVLPYLRETFFKFESCVINIVYDGKVLQTQRAFLSVPKPLEYPPVDKKGNALSTKSTVWKKKLDFKHEGKRVKGFIMILETGGYSQPGLRLLRNRRVIVGTQGGDRQNKPKLLLKTSNKYAAQRIYGELSLNDHRVDFMKTGFDDDLDSLYEYIHKILKGDGKDSKSNYLHQTEYFRKGKANSTSSGGSTDGGSTDGDSTDEGSTDEGSTDEGSTDEGSTDGGSTDGGSTDGGSTDGGSGHKDDTKIELSPIVKERIDKTGSKKLSSLYNSLTKTSLVSHPALAYVGAWSFLESLCSYSSYAKNKTYTTDFNSFISNKMNSWFPKDRSKRTAIRAVMQDIADNGNATKHDAIYYPTDAKKLAVSFKSLEPVFTKLLDEIIEELERSC